MKRVLIFCIGVVILGGFSGCKKLVAIAPPINETTTQEVFSNDELATNALLGIYTDLLYNSGSVFGMGFGNGFITVWAGASSDELMFFDQTNTIDVQFQDNKLLSSNTAVDGGMWAPGYNIIYAANAAIAGLSTSTGIHDSIRNELTGEAEFVRAFLYFYLVNSFSNIPLVTTTNFEKTSLLSNSPASSFYQLMVSDLKDAQQRLPPNFSVGQGQRIIPNKYAAAALLARVYLYEGDWADAVSEADTVIGNTGLFSLVPLSQVFLMNSMEAIWQLQLNNNTGSTFNITPEGNLIIPFNSTSQPFIYLTPNILSAFERADQRYSNWVDSTVYSGTTYYYPFKYKDGPAVMNAGANIKEYYMVLRLGEQFLIRAEAEAHGVGGGLAAAISDINVIRTRAGLGSYAGPPSNPDSVLAAVYHERQVELFAEWGHRWYDLKRTGQAENVFAAIPYKQPWSNDALFYPIPYGELITDPNLVQNPGY